MYVGLQVVAGYKSESLWIHMGSVGWDVSVCMERIQVKETRGVLCTWVNFCACFCLCVSVPIYASVSVSIKYFITSLIISFIINVYSSTKS